MLPVWPFSTRSIRHRTFGKLKPIRNGKYWRARIALPQSVKPVDVQINAGQSGPTADQEGLFLRLAAQYPSVFSSALQAVHTEYQRVRLSQPQLKWPAAEDLSALEYLTPLDSIWLDDHLGEQFVFSFGHRHDKDHSFHVFFEGGRVKSVASER